MIRLLLVAASISLFSMAGCRQPGSLSGNGSGTALDLPAPGSIKVVPRMVTETNEEACWVFSVLGDRAWKSHSLLGRTIALGSSAPFNTPQARGGTHVWEIECRIVRGASKVTYTVRLRGSNAKTGSTSGELTSDKPASSLLSPGFKQAESFKVPADIELAKIGDEVIRLRIEK